MFQRSDQCVHNYRIISVTNTLHANTSFKCSFTIFFLFIVYHKLHVHNIQIVINNNCCNIALDLVSTIQRSNFTLLQEKTTKCRFIFIKKLPYTFHYYNNIIKKMKKTLNSIFNLLFIKYGSDTI